MLLRSPVRLFCDGELPDPVGLPDFGGARTGADFGAAIRRIARGQDHQPRIVDKAVRILKALGIAVWNEGPADLVAGQIDRTGRRQQMPAADMVVEEQAQP